MKTDINPKSREESLIDSISIFKIKTTAHSFAEFVDIFHTYLPGEVSKRWMDGYIICEFG